MPLFKYPVNLIEDLSSRPKEKFVQSGVSYQIIIPDFNSKIDEHYDLKSYGASPFKNFGLIIEYDEPTEIPLFTDELVLCNEAKSLIESFGPVVFCNAFVPKKLRGGHQKNIFPDLVFHVDRGKHFENQYSFFMRDPDDPEQKHPRKSSTLLTDFKVAKLQFDKEGGRDFQPGISNKMFSHSLVEKYKNKILIEQKWSKSEGVGEMCVSDNRTVLHSSYYREGRGYKIGVRYLY